MIKRFRTHILIAAPGSKCNALAASLSPVLIVGQVIYFLDILDHFNHLTIFQCRVFLQPMLKCLTSVAHFTINRPDKKSASVLFIGFKVSLGWSRMNFPPCGWSHRG